MTWPRWCPLADRIARVMAGPAGASPYGAAVEASRSQGRSTRDVMMAGGILGPACFITAWGLSAVMTGADYSSVDEAISRLAAVGSDVRWLMTAGFIVFGLSVLAFGFALRRRIPGWSWSTAMLTALATLGVAATPLDRSGTVDQWHAVFAVAGYVTLAMTPILAAAPLARLGHRSLARFGVAMGLVSTVALVLSATPLPNGVFQRAGLTATDGWIMCTAWLGVTGRLSGSADQT